MIYTGYELLWLFFVCSFLGWLLETVTAALKQKRFVNRGLVNAPFCVLYGFSAVFITIFGRELNGIWLFLGSCIIATVFEWVAGHLIERFYHEKWWDYSNIKWNVDGYIALPMSAIWGALAFVLVKWGNGFFLSVFHLLPDIAGIIVVWVLFGLLALDILATLMIMSGRSKDMSRWETVDRTLTRYTAKLGHKIYSHVDKRIQKAYPQAKKLDVPKETSTVFAHGCSFHKIVWLFFIGAFLGDITETIFCRVVGGEWMSRSSVVWGPFSIVWGLAIAFATLLLYRYREKSDRYLFAVGTFLGGAYEYICSVFTEIVFGKVFWDYSHIPFNLGGRINLLYCFFWGIAAVVWMKLLYPKASALIEKVPVRLGKIITWLLVVFMCCDMAVSGLALIRSTQRTNGVPAKAGWQRIMDERFDDERLERIYPNAIDTK